MISQENLPSAVDAERAVLSAVMLDGNLLDVVSEYVKEPDFFLEKHRVVFRAMAALRATGSPIDERTLQAHLEIRGELSDAGGMPYIAGMAADLPDVSAVAAYAQIVSERSLRRRIIAAAIDMIKDAQGGECGASEALARAEASVLAMGLDSTRGGLVSYRDSAPATLERLAARKSSALLGRASGFSDIDHITGGLVNGNLIIIAGRPGMGKTAWAMNAAQNVAFRGAGVVAVFSLEMSREELELRVMASEAQVPFKRLRTGQLSSGQWGKVMNAVRDQDGGRLWIDEAPSPSPFEIASKARRLRKEKGELALLVIDYLQLLTMPGKHDNRNNEIATISRFFKLLARELGCPIMLLSQLNRNTEHRGANDKRPQLGDLRDSGAVEQDADMVGFLYRDEVYFPEDEQNKGLAEFIVSKNRNGELGTATLFFFGEEVRFASRSYQEESGPGIGQSDNLPFDFLE